MRNISFSLTTPQFKARTKTVTRRLGWEHLKAGDRLMGCEKCMGRKPGEPLVRLGEIEVVEVRREPLSLLRTVGPEYGPAELIAEGFPCLHVDDFISMFCRTHKGCTEHTLVTRIVFRYL